MLNTSGLSATQAYNLIQNKRDIFVKGVEKDVIAKREIEAFKERIGQIKNVDELLKDREVYSFVMKSMGMEGEMFAKAMNKKIMTSDLEDKKSLVSRMTSRKYKELNVIMGFKPDGSAGDFFAKPEWVGDMVSRYVNQRIVDNQNANNPTVGTALTFKEKASTFKNWYSVLGDKDATTLLRTALGIPTDSGKMDIDAQARAFEKKMKIEDLQDPKKVDKIISKYNAISGAMQASQTLSPALTLFSSMSSGSYAMINIDIQMVQGFSAYRSR